MSYESSEHRLGITDAEPRAPTLEDVLDDYLQELAEGNQPDQRAVLDAHPEHASALRGIFRTLDFVEATSQSLKLPAIERGRVLGDFRIRREIGRGGMGVVYEADQISLKRKVALKVLPAGAVLAGGATERFQREAATAGRLHHTNIVPVHASGVEDGIRFYAMQFIAGNSLANHLNAMRDAGTRPGRDYYRRVASWGRQAAEALQYAHEHGAIHRDIKPSNLLLDERDVVWLTDFGLARDDCNASITLSGDVIGTARYMSPEQARGGHARLDKRTDVYSLGATLYELLTLQPPYDSDSRDAILSQIAFADPPRPRRIAPHLPRDLETIVLKCMEKDAVHRYASAAEVAEDCRRFLAGDPIRARRVSILRKTARFVRRYRIHCAAVTLSLGLLAAILVLTITNRHAKSNALLADAFDAILFEDDTNRANQFLKRAESLGNDSASLYLYRGLIPLLNAQPQRALADLQDAYRRDDDNVETCYALSAAYYALGDTVNGDRYFRKTENCTINSALGWLLRGHALSRIQAPGAIEAFNRAVALRADFTPAIEARAYYRGYRLLTEGADDDLRAMLNDFDAWVVFRPDSPRSYAARASGWMFAAGHALSRPELRANLKTWLANCGRDLDRAKQLSPEPDVSILSRESVYRRLTGDFAGASEVMQQALEIDRQKSLGQHEGIVYHRSIALLATGDIDQALAEVGPACDSLPDFSPLTMQHAILLAEVGRIDEAVRICQSAVERHRSEPTNVCLLAGILALLGHADDAANAVRSVDVGPSASDAIPVATLAFLRGECTAEFLRSQVQDAPALRCNAELMIALSQIGRGDRDAGRTALRQCYDTGIFIFVEHRLAQALLARMESEPDWPSWIK